MFREHVMWELLLVTLLKWVLVIGGLWVAVRFSRLVPWFKARKQAENYAHCAALWDALTAGAVSTATE